LRILIKVLIDAASKDLDRLHVISALTSRKFKDYALENICKSESEKRFIDSLPAWEFDGRSNQGKRKLSKTAKR